jgi:hypothetical protein
MGRDAAHQTTASLAPTSVGKVRPRLFSEQHILIYPTFLYYYLLASVGDLWHFGADPGPTPDPTPFFSDFNVAKKKFHNFLLITYPLAHY